jgi:beta-lactamase superfamily II metal-dependent hydrolase
LEAIKPRLAFIEVGKNSYGHPTKEALDRLNAVGARVFRTDLDGTVKLIIDGERIKVFKNKNNPNSKDK